MSSRENKPQAEALVEGDCRFVAGAVHSVSENLMSFRKLLIANRGEIAIRVARAAADCGIAAVAIYPADDALSLHVRSADEAHAIPGRGARAYLDIEAVVAAAKTTGCDALHPGYGFLSENSALARRCAEEKITFVGPSPEALDLFGDKVVAKALAQRCKVPVIDGTSGPTTLADAKAFFASLGKGGAVMIKAMAGGGGRGMRVVEDGAKLEEAYGRCQSEAKAAFGSDGVYVERLIRKARHIEVQIIGDRHGAISHLWERECTIQRRNQKLIEVAPSPSLSDGLRRRIVEAAKQLAAAASCLADSMMRARSASLSDGLGATSISFWCRRWIVHSRSQRWLMAPWRSPTICTSIWRALRISRST